MARLKIFWAILVCISARKIYGIEDENMTTEFFEETTEIPPPKNKTLTELVQEQTDAIRKIISEHKPQDYPVVTRKEAEIKDVAAIKAEKEKQSIEELKYKCQHYFKLLQEGKLEQKTTEKPRVTILPFGPVMKPEFLRLKPKFPSAIRTNPPKIQTGANFFIFTQNPSELYGTRTNKLADKLETSASNVYEDKIPINTDDTINTTMINHNTQEFYQEDITNQTDTNKNESIKLKYVKLEPLILQKTLLTNGKTLFYWYKPLLGNQQSFVQIPDTPENENVNTVAQPQQHEQSIPVPEQYQFYVDPQTGAIIRNLKTSTTPPPISSTTPKPQTSPPQLTRPQYFINPQTGLIYQHSLPHQFIYHRRAQDIPTTTTTPKPTTISNAPLVPSYAVEYSEPTERYRNEYRFVIPMLVTGNPDISKYPYQFDPYAYLPKNQRPELMNIAVPYVPNYHMIRTLTVPKKTDNE